MQAFIHSTKNAMLFTSNNHDAALLSAYYLPNFKQVEGNLKEAKQKCLHSDPSAFQFLTQNLIGKFGISLAARLLHQLAHKEALQFGLATTKSLNLVGMSC